jgi:glycine cleavage system T protein (aminomethyltransferase)
MIANTANNRRPIFERPVLETAFYDSYKHLIQNDQYEEWAGYTTLASFACEAQEYFAVRNTCGVYDLCPMIKYDIGGPDAERYMNRLVTRNVSKMQPQRVTYTVWCDDNGHVIEDGTVFRLSATEFRLCCAERQIDWLLDCAIGYDVTISEATESIAGLAVQGPVSCKILRKMNLAGVENLKPFQFGFFRLNGYDVMISRTGFTGDLGYEVWVDAVNAKDLWQSLFEAGKPHGIRMIGSRALNMLRIEAGLIMVDVEFASCFHTVRLNRDRTPFELGLDWVVDMNKGHFIGRRALHAAMKKGLRRKLVGIDVDWNRQADGALIYDSKRCQTQVGEVTSALWSPILKRNIALAYLDAPYFEGSRELWAEVYLNRECVWERKVYRCRVTDKPFYAPERKKITPPNDY